MNTKRLIYTILTLLIITFSVISQNHKFVDCVVGGGAGVVGSIPLLIIIFKAAITFDGSAHFNHIIGLTISQHVKAAQACSSLPFVINPIASIHLSCILLTDADE